MKLSRRSFLGGSLAGALLADVGCAVASAGSSVSHARNKVVFVSDPHAAADLPGMPAWQRETLSRIVDEILAMRPLPTCVVNLGDLAFSCGCVEDYRTTRPLFDRLTAAGIRVCHAMGNHDRRETFLSVYPEAAARFKNVPGRLVTRVETRDFDILVLDSLQQGDDPKSRGPVRGILDDAQLAWLERTLKTVPRPALVALHHPLDALDDGGAALRRILVESPACCGLVCGHDHVWRREMVDDGAQSGRALRALVLPSAGHWGDIGYVVAESDEQGIDVALRQFDYYKLWNPTPTSRQGKVPVERVPSEWAQIVRENQGQRMRFYYHPHHC